MKNIRYYLLGAAIALAFLQTSVTNAKGIEFDMLEATPIGSWQIREDTTTDQKGRQTVTSLKSSMLGEETRNGEQYYWIEMVIDSFKVKKNGKRKPTGDRAIMKTLMPASTLSGDPANVMTNLRGLGEELIIQNGKDDPIIIRGAGGFMGGLMKSMGTEVNYDFTDLGMETVTVAAGEFSGKKIQGTGSTEAKILFNKIKVESDSTVWMSSKVPFGMVKTEGQSVTNGKTTTFSSELLEYGTSGATTLITKPPQEMPDMKSIFGQ